MDHSMADQLKNIDGVTVKERPDLVSNEVDG